MKTRPRILVLLCLALTVSAARARPAAAQVAGADEVAEAFLRGFQSMAWEGLAQRLHPEALAYVRLAIDIVIDSDTTTWGLRHLAGGAAGRAAYEAMDDRTVFLHAMRAVQAEFPGLLSSLVTRSAEVVGSVAEGADTAHVVYRTLTLVQGAEPRVQVLTAVRTADGWRIRRADEVEVLHTALRGVPIPREP